MRKEQCLNVRELASVHGDVELVVFPRAGADGEREFPEVVVDEDFGEVLQLNEDVGGVMVWLLLVGWAEVTFSTDGVFGVDRVCFYGCGCPSPHNQSKDEDEDGVRSHGIASRWT